MMCHDVRDRLDDVWENGETEEVQRHLRTCAPCTQYLRELRQLRSGFQLLKEEEVPAPSLGFAERLVRQLGEISRAPSVTEFFERVGRRFVYATLVLTFLALLAMALPSTGPVRGLSLTDIQITSQEASLAYSDPVGDPAALGVPEVAPVETAVPGPPDEVK
jgi:hypothetical protein